MHIDWSTLALQTINVLILVWILARFLFRPVQAIVAKRQAQAAALLADAVNAKRQAEESAAAAERARQNIEEQKEQLIVEAQSEAAKEKARLIETAQKDIAHLRAEAAIAEAQEKSASEQALIARVKELAAEIAKKLMSRVSPEAGLEVFVDGLCGALEKLPAETRAAFPFKKDQSESVDVITAVPISGDAEAQLRKRLELLLGQEVALNFGIDPAVIAGIELHGHTVVLCNSLRQDLNNIVADLNFEV